MITTENGTKERGGVQITRAHTHTHTMRMHIAALMHSVQCRPQYAGCEKSVSGGLKFERVILRTRRDSCAYRFLRGPQKWRGMRPNITQSWLDDINRVHTRVRPGDMCYDSWWWNFAVSWCQLRWSHLTGQKIPPRLFHLLQEDCLINRDMMFVLRRVKPFRAVRFERWSQGLILNWIPDEVLWSKREIVRGSIPLLIFF